jgi:hypothetical protein
MTSGNKCKVKDDLVNQLIALNNKLNTLSTAFLRSQQARAEVQERRETLYVDIKRHRAKGHEGKPCPAAQRLLYSRRSGFTPIVTSPTFIVDVPPLKSR